MAKVNTRVITPNIVLCYRRRSVVKTKEDRVSPERQKDAVEAIVRHVHNLTPEWYEDIDGHSSGRYAEGRSGWQDLLSQLERADIVGVAAYDLSRLYRNVQEFLDFVNLLNRRQLRLIVVKESVDTSSATGLAIMTILMAMYQLESDLASERMTANIDYKRRQMGRHWGPIPFGCLRDEEHNLIPDPLTAPTLQRCYELFATGEYTYEKLADTLNLDGDYLRDREGNLRPWTRDDTRRILAGWRLYRGELPIGRQKDSHEHAEVLKGAHDAIIDPKLCLAVGMELQKRRARYTTGDIRRQTYLLTPLLYCGHCGALMAGSRVRGQPMYRHDGSKKDCPEKQTPVEILDDEVLNIFARLAESSVLQAALQEELDNIRAHMDPLAAEIMAQIHAITARRDKLTDGYLAEIIPDAEYRVRRVALDQEIEALRKQLPLNSLDFERILESTLGLLRELGDEDLPNQKRILGMLLERIETKGGHISKIEPRDWARPFF